MVVLQAYVKDIDGVGIYNVPVDFTNITPDFGILETGVEYTDTLGIAYNKLVGIDTEAFDLTDEFDEIKLEASVKFHIIDPFLDIQTELIN